MKEKIYLFLPHFIQNLLITLFDYLAYRKRHGGVYNRYKKYFKKAEMLTLEELQEEQEKRLSDFIRNVYHDSTFYQELWKNVKDVDLNNITLKDLSKLPLVSKEDIRKNIDKICVNKSKKIVSHTGGTTGKSLTVYFSKENAQERFACLDNFKNRFEWKFGDKTAWFSGKNILNRRDIKKNRYWKTDMLYNIRYYSTFHISEKTAEFYINDFNKYQPIFFSGFPSSITEIAKIGIKKSMKLDYQVKGIFPTAESITDEDKAVMKKFYGCEIYDQYASSEGAPFITQCKNGHMHLEMLTGVFEILDDNGKTSDSGELIVTAFATEATPLIRYRIEDSIELETKPISCENKAPVVKKIHGRINDFIYSEERGKINLGNVSNIVKYVKGVVQFQFIQNSKELIEVLIVKDDTYKQEDENMLVKELRDRLGKHVKIEFKYVSTIFREKSGKYRIVKNNLKI